MAATAVCAHTLDTCLNSDRCTSGYNCCPAGTGIWYVCPSGCTGGGAFNTCDCGTIDNLTDRTGTYTGTSCTTTAEQITTTCYTLTRNPPNPGACLGCSPIKI